MDLRTIQKSILGIESNRTQIMRIMDDSIYEYDNDISLLKDNDNYLPKKEIDKHIIYLKMAKIWASNSKCHKKKVGSIIVKGDSIISDGYNGTPSGFENDCEDEEGNTKWYVLHAEANAITKLSKSTQSSEGGTLYITMSPCKECSKKIIQTGIKRLVFYEFYRDLDGLLLLLKSGIDIVWINKENIC